MELAGKKVAVIGMGKTGVAVSFFVGEAGAAVVAIDEKAPQVWGADAGALREKAWFGVGHYDPSALAGVDLVVPSPGVPPGNIILDAAQKKNIPIMSEIELAYRFIDTPIVAVTGTNGKTTTTTILGRIIEQAGKKVFVGGNIGNPLVQYAAGAQAADLIVAEISSFQLQWADTFRPHAAVLLNITPDHINYHGSFSEYRRVKESIFAHQQPEDLAVVNEADSGQSKPAVRLASRVMRFSSAGPVRPGAFLQGSSIIYSSPEGKEEKYPLDMIRLPGLHNVENVMAALILARFCGCEQEAVIEAVSSFGGLPHRIEFAGEKNGVKFYDDSKGTNVDAVARALQTFSAPVILLLGGRDKDGKFDALQTLLQTKAKQVVLFGEARERICPQLGEVVPIQSEQTLRAAVASAFHSAKPGDVVLLSPGCASFDEFTDYRERGNYFKEVVGKL
ncbi:MAG TPA: UDP-N-acetylmuramoyl-L-alanine--D-glutamate ligase [Smithellaceae bacterium]|nr:UDP-N-acetylmuramoyl-L-alanine--D-glutamate ligase [Smithellaceae bacterium]HQF83675.1 UDP-N-acetylmuramoyl-L-alanine--D-glutamate ligase [Smithellaceae bacterium]HQG79776.1 UDP-N-acetylmuramoyl-L-alanine--D-glutamate ligase [Smithellaceae bacterium]